MNCKQNCKISFEEVEVILFDPKAQANPY